MLKSHKTKLILPKPILSSAQLLHPLPQGHPGQAHLGRHHSTLCGNTEHIRVKQVEAFFFHLLIHRGPVHLGLDVRFHVLQLYPLLPCSASVHNLLQGSAMKIKPAPHHTPPNISLHSLLYLDLPSTVRLTHRNEHTSTSSGGLRADQSGFSFYFCHKTGKIHFLSFSLNSVNCWANSEACKTVMIRLFVCEGLIILMHLDI